MTDCQLYVFSPRISDPDAFAPILTELMETRKVACFCLRVENNDPALLERATKLLCPIAQKNDCAFLIEATPDIALELGTDGVHLDADEYSIKEFRQKYGPDLIIGANCHDSVHQAIDAGEFGADYVFFGPMAPSENYPSQPPIDDNMPRWWAKLTEVPCVIGGGITEENIDHFLSLGTEFIALSLAIFTPSGINVKILDKFDTIPHSA